MNIREIEEAGMRFYAAKGRANGEMADGPDRPACRHCDDDGCAECRLVLTDSDLDELEALCYRCVGETGWVDPQCGKCDGAGRIDAPDHPDWCRACGMTGRCPDCDPDRYRDEAMDR